jgi:hypothetical protein
MLGLASDSALQMPLRFSAVMFFLMSLSVLCWPLRKSEQRAIVWGKLQHPAKWIAELIEPSHIIILGLAIALGGAIWQMRGVPQGRSEAQAETRQDDPKIIDLKSQLETTKSQLTTTKAELDAKRKEFELIQLTPTAEKDVKQNRLRFKLDQAKIDKDDFDKAIAAVRASAEGALSVTKAWAINPPQFQVGNMPLRAEQTWEEQIRGLQKICDRVFPGEKFVVLPGEPTPKQLTYPAPGDSEMKDPDSKQRYRILNFRTGQQEYTMKQIERKIEDEIYGLTNQIREMR